MQAIANLFLAVANFAGLQQLAGGESCKIDEPQLRQQVWDNSSGSVTYWKNPTTVPTKEVNWRWVTVVPDYAGRGTMDAPYVQ